MLSDDNINFTFEVTEMFAYFAEHRSVGRMRIINIILIVTAYEETKLLLSIDSKCYLDIRNILEVKSLLFNRHWGQCSLRLDHLRVNDTWPSLAWNKSLDLGYSYGAIEV